jgi:hypothetical protein
MLEMDRIIVEVDPLLKREMNGMLLRRLDFCRKRAGKNQKLTQNVIERSKGLIIKSMLHFNVRSAQERWSPTNMSMLGSMGKDSLELYDQNFQ